MVFELNYIYILHVCVCVFFSYIFVYIFLFYLFILFFLYIILLLWCIQLLEFWFVIVSYVIVALVTQFWQISIKKNSSFNVLVILSYYGNYKIFIF